MPFALALGNNPQGGGSMKNLIGFLFCFIPTLVYADFQPGRVRAVAEAQLEVKGATGQFENLSNASVVLFSEDGVGPVKMVLRWQDGSLEFPLSKDEDTGCRRMHLSQQTDGAWNQATALLTDFSQQMKCGLFVENPWHVQIEIRNADGSVSHLQAEGKPEYFILTM